MTMKTKKTLVIDGDLHKELRIAAAYQGLKIQEIVEELIKEFVKGMKGEK